MDVSTTFVLSSWFRIIARIAFLSEDLSSCLRIYLENLAEDSS